MELHERIRRRALWDGISHRSQHFMSMSQIDKIMPIDVIAELNSKGYWDGTTYNQIALDAVRYAVNSHAWYEFSGPGAHRYPITHIGVHGDYCRNTPIVRVFALRKSIRWRLHHAGLVLVGDLVAFRKEHGTDWYRHLKGIGPKSADHVERVLFAD